MSRMRVVIFATVAVVLLAVAGILSFQTDLVVSKVEGPIDAPIDLVFEFIIEPDERPKWMQFVESSVQMSGFPGEKGAQMLMMVEQEGYKVGVFEELISVDEPSSLRFQIDEETANVTTTYRLEEIDGGTHLIIETERILKKGWAKTFAFFLRGSSEKYLQYNFTSLKRLAESAN